VQVIHGLNFAIFMVALWTFTFFLRSMQAGWRKSNREPAVESPLFVAFGFAIFLSFSLKYIGLANVTPDLAIAALVFLAVGIVWRITAGIDRGLGAYVALGTVLGLSYLFKTSFFLLSFALIMILFLVPPAPTWSRRKVLVVCLIFLLVCLPWVITVSRRLGTPSIGGVGPLSYVWYVNHPELTPYAGWDGRFGSMYSTLSHPPRMLMSDPVVMEFGSPLPGTHPLWYDPSYWWQGAKVKFDIAAQLAALRTNLHVMFDWVVRMAPLIAGAFALLVIRLRNEPLRGVQRIWIWQTLWPLAACAVYLPVHAEQRFLGAFLAVFWVSVYAYLLPRKMVGIRAAVLMAVMAAVLLPFAVSRVHATLISLRHPERPADQVAASALRSMGLKPGDALATVGVEFQPFYARRARLRAVAYVDAPDGAWTLPSADFERLKTRLASAGIRALVTRGRPGLPNPQEWTAIDLAEAGRLQVLLLLQPSNALKQPFLPRYKLPPVICGHDSASVRGIARDEVCDLCPARPRRIGYVSSYQIFFQPVQAGVLVSHKRPLRTGVHLLPASSLELYGPTTCVETRPYLLQTCCLGIVPSDGQSTASPLSPSG
jgi:hypothetical protein